MTCLEHDGAASLRVEYRTSAFRKGNGSAGWFVVRTCPCHKDLPITRPFDNQEQAARVLAVLDLDARMRHERR